jgi:dihydropteroate synthase
VGPARAAVEAGARILNDVSGLRDPRLAALAAERGLDLLLMAAPPLPPGAVSGDPVAAVGEALRAVLARSRAAGIPDERVVLDPGIGFFRDVPRGWVDWDLAVLDGLPALASLERPLCVGVSRKSFLGAITGRPDPADRLAASLAATAIAVVNGAAAVRAHDVRETVDAVRVAERLRRPGR